MKIGILGGSFDPIHNGHLNMAIQAKNEFDLDEVWLIPAGHSPNKDETKMTPASDRLEMTRLACANYAFLKGCDIEICSKERSYTYRTLEKLIDWYPENEFFFIMGADSLDYLDKWVHPELICKYAKILVVNRGEFTHLDLENKIQEINSLFPANIQIVDCNKMDVSSHEIRALLQSNDSVQSIVPENVLQYIRQKHLYN